MIKNRFFTIIFILIFTISCSTSIPNIKNRISNLENKVKILEKKNIRYILDEFNYNSSNLTKKNTIKLKEIVKVINSPKFREK